LFHIPVGDFLSPTEKPAPCTNREPAKHIENDTPTTMILYHFRAANARERKFPGCYFYTLFILLPFGSKYA